MKARQTRPRIGRKKAEGQSIPLIAVMLVVLIGFVALSVDVGTAYAEQRVVIRATDTAVLAGMTAYLQPGSNSQMVWQAMQNSLVSNGIDLNNVPEGRPGRYRMSASYLDRAANQVSEVRADAALPNQVAAISLRVEGTVDTTFARLFGITSFPMNSTKYSGRRVCEPGTFPIIINTRAGQTVAFSGSGFTQPDGLYAETSLGQPLSWERVYLDNPTQSNFNFGRWMEDTPIVLNDDDTINDDGLDALAEMLNGQGNLQRGFQELTTWPPDSTNPMPAQFSDPDILRASFPFQESTLNPLDWVYGNRANRAALEQGLADVNGAPSALKQALDWHVANRTILTTLVRNDHNGDVDDPAYYVESFAAFILLNYGVDATNGFYLDLAFVPDGLRECAAPLTELPTDLQLFGLSGGVSFWPSWQENIVAAIRPVSFLIVFDVTGSMTWTFDGKGQNPENGETVFCTGPNRNADCAGFLWAYGNRDDPATSGVDERALYNQRRIYIAKDVLRAFAQNVQDTSFSRPNDIVRILPFTGDVGDFYDGSNPAANANQPATAIVNSIKQRLVPGAWVNTYAALSGAIENAGMINGDPYLTNGATSSASGLRAAYEILDGPDTPDHVPGNPALQYRKIVIFVTDGVANVFTNGLYNNQPGCIGEFQECNTGDPVTLPGGTEVLKPLDAMVEEARRLKVNVLEPTDGKLYVIALAGVDTTGLGSVASGQDAVQQADNPEALRLILENIRQDALFGECVQGSTLNPVNNIGTGNVASIANWSLSSDEAGYVYLWAEGSNPSVDDPDYTVPIRMQTGTGIMSYSFSDLPLGTYQMKAALAIRWLDGTDRLYTNFTDGDTGTTGSGLQTVQINANATGLGGRVNLPLVLQLAGDPCAGSQP